MNTSTRDAGIPVLTEVIAAPQADPPNTVAPAPIYPAAPAATSFASAPSLQAPRFSTAPVENRTDASLSSDQWSQLEREIRERILQQIVGRIDALLEQRLRDSMTGVLQTVVQSLTTEIKTSLRHTIDDVVTRAVSVEIARMQSSKK
jgi:hypothetical protein